MYLYVLTNTVNGKRYVGQTIRPLEKRLREHERASCRTIVAHAIRKHGWDKFRVDSCEVESLEHLNELEEFMVKELDSHCSRNGYNAKRGGSNHGGQPITKKARAKISAALTGRPCSEETRRKISESNKAWTRTPEQIAKQAESLRGRRMPKYQREKLSMALKGRVVSEETRAKIGAANKGKRRSPEIVELYRQRMLGKKLSDETRAKMSASQKARTHYPPRPPVSDETRAKLSAAAKAAWARKRGDK